MKLERLHEYVIPVIATLLGIFVAAYCGKLSGAGQMGTLATLLAAMTLTIMVLTMKERVWVLLPLLWGFSGKISLIPLPFSVSNLAALFIFTVFLVFQALGLYRRKMEIWTLDLFAAANIVFLFSVFIRNPVGLLAFGSTRVGGRPYFEIAMAVPAYLVLARVAVGVKQASTIPKLIAGGSLFQGVIQAVTFYFPALIPIIAPIYSGVAADASDPGLATGLSITNERQGYLAGVAVPCLLALLSFYRPLTLINPFYFGRFLLFIAAMMLALFSGFRSVVFLSGVYFLLSSYLHNGFKDLIRSLLLAIAPLLIIVPLQGHLVEFPFSVQRALSFLPGKWSQQAENDAAHSTRWRIEMWREYLGSDKYIRDRWLGDGFGFSQGELAALMHNRLFGKTNSQEEAMLVGSVHSGPISTIRYVGYVGLSLYLCLSIGLSWTAWGLIQRARTTPFFSTALFVGMPLIYAPLEFVLVYGTLDVALPAALFGMGMLKILTNSLNQAEKESVVDDSDGPMLPSGESVHRWPTREVAGRRFEPVRSTARTK